MMNKGKVIVDHLEIITTKTVDNKTYYELKYHDVEANEWYIGYSSYSLPIVLSFILEYFILKWWGIIMIIINSGVELDPIFVFILLVISVAILIYAIYLFIKDNKND